MIVQCGLKPYSMPAPTSQPEFGVGALPNDAGKVQRGISLDPATAKLAVEKPTILHETDAARRRPNPVLAHRAERRCRKRGMSKSRPIEIALDAKQEVTHLNVIAKLNAANETTGRCF
jgi:hypothetical protein